MSKSIYQFEDHFHISVFITQVWPGSVDIRVKYPTSHRIINHIRTKQESGVHPYHTGLLFLRFLESKAVRPKTKHTEHPRTFIGSVVCARAQLQVSLTADRC